MCTNSLHKEIDLIQSCITRMAHNSFLVKGWTVSLVAVVLALMKDRINLYVLCVILLVPILSFWYLDGYFLRTEKKYRKLYEWVIKARLEGNQDHLYELDISRFDTEVKSIWGVMMSSTLGVFYGIMFLSIVLIVVVKLTLMIVSYLNLLCLFR